MNTWRGCKVTSQIPPEMEERIFCAVREIEHRICACGIKYTYDDFIITERDGVWFVIGNPLLYECDVLGDLGMPCKYSIYNVMLLWNEGVSCVMDTDDTGYTLEIPAPHVQVLIPEFIVRLENSDG